MLAHQNIRVIGDDSESTEYRVMVCRPVATVGEKAMCSMYTSMGYEEEERRM